MMACVGGFLAISVAVIPRLYWPRNKDRIYRILISKLREARYRLYERRSLQVNTRWKALEEIFKIHKPLHRSELQNVAKFRRTSFGFF